MLSIGDLVDKLVIENIKIFNIREKLHNNPSDEEEVKLNEIMMKLVSNRDIISNALDNKVTRVVSKEEKNVILQKIKTYEV